MLPSREKEAQIGWQAAKYELKAQHESSLGKGLKYTRPSHSISERYRGANRDDFGHLGDVAAKQLVGRFMTRLVLTDPSSTELSIALSTFSIMLWDRFWLSLCAH